MNKSLPVPLARVKVIMDGLLVRNNVYRPEFHFGLIASRWTD